MDYGKLITQAFTIVKERRYLWWLGILTALTEGSYVKFYQYNLGNSDIEKIFNDSLKSTENSGNVLGVSDSAYVLGIFIAIILIFIISLVILYVSYSARAGLMKSVDRIDSGDDSWKFRDAFRAGRRSFWRLLGYYLLLFLSVIVLLAVFSVPTVFLFLWQQTLGNVLGVTLIIIGLLALFAWAILISLITPFAERNVVIADQRIIQAIRTAWDSLVKKFMKIFLTYLVNVGLSMAYMMAVGFAVLIIGSVLFGIGYLLYSVNIVATYIYAGVAGLALSLVLLAVGGFFTAFLSSYWTIAYRQIRQDQ